MTWENKNVLITGATHFIASHLAERLVRSGSNVKAFIPHTYHNERGSLDRLPVYTRNGVEVITGSLTNPEVVDYAIMNTDVLFHFGALDTVPPHYGARDYLEKTVIGTFNVLSTARKHTVQKVIHVSTAEVYGKAESMPIKEEGPLEARSPYVSSDIAAEKLVEGYFWFYNLPVTIARLFNTYGPAQSSDAIIPTIISQVFSGTQLLLGDMQTLRDFIYVKDVVDGLMRMAEAPGTSGEAINLGSGNCISIEELADKIVGLIGRSVEILFDATRIRLQGPKLEKLVADITKAYNFLGWQPQTSLDDGLRQTIDWFFERI